MSEIQFFVEKENGQTEQIAVSYSNFVPRVGELVIFREVENGEDVFGDYEVVEIAHRYLIESENEAEPEFHIVTLRDYKGEEEEAAAAE